MDLGVNIIKVLPSFGKSFCYTDKDKLVKVMPEGYRITYEDDNMVVTREKEGIRRAYIIKNQEWYDSIPTYKTPSYDEYKNKKYTEN